MADNRLEARIDAFVKRLQKEGELYLQENLRTEENLKYFEELGVKITDKF